MNAERDPLEAPFEELRHERIPAAIEREIEQRLLGRRSRAWLRGKRALYAAAAGLLLVGGVGAAIVHWWRVRIDTSTHAIEGGELKELTRDADGSAEYELELPDGRRVRVHVPPPSGVERRIDVQLPDPRAAEEPAPLRKP
jgi:hypothetical protein